MDSNSIDISLVKQVRNLLQAEWDNGNQQGQYSEPHYRDIMDSQSPYTCWRYLLSNDLNVNEAFKAMKSALIWRKENKADAFHYDYFCKELYLYSSIFFTRSKTKNGEDIMISIPRLHTRSGQVMLSMILYHIQNFLYAWDREHKNDLKKFTIIFDLTDASIKNMDTDVVRWLITAVDHLPARPSEIYIVGLTLLMRPIVRMLIGLAPKRYRNSIYVGSHEELIKPNIDSENLPVECGGTLSELIYRVAPIEAVWANELPILMDKKFLEQVDQHFFFHVDAKRREQLIANQLEYEKRLAK